MAKFFADASFFVALYKKDDQNHKKAVQTVDKLKEKDEIFVNFVCIGEAATIISQRVDKLLANKLVEDYRLQEYQEIIIDSSVVSLAVNIFSGQKSKNFPFFDAIHAASMQSMGLTKALTFDKHFKTLGCKIIS